MKALQQIPAPEARELSDAEAHAALVEAFGVCYAPTIPAALDNPALALVETPEDRFMASVRRAFNVLGGVR